MTNSPYTWLISFARGWCLVPAPTFRGILLLNATAAVWYLIRETTLISVPKPPLLSDLVFLNETASDEKDEMELRRQTAWDAALVNQNISSGLSSKRNPASQKYPKHQYAKLNFGESASLYVRSEIDSQCDNNNIIIKSILDNDPRGINPEWQQKIDNQRGAVLVKELTNNNALISRWVIQAIIANVDILKLAYVIRTPNVPRKDNSFSVIAVEDYVPTELANQIGINIYNGFGIIKAISEKISSLPVYSQYILMKDPNRPQMRIYGASF